MGLPEEQLDAIRKQLLEAHAQALFEVWPENWHALQVFRAMATQWHVLAGWGGHVYQGLRYESLPVVIAAHKRNPHRQPFDELMYQVAYLERSALEVINER